MFDLYLIRHSMTYGNTLGRYIGKLTDEPLCKEGIELLKNRVYPKVEAVFVSPLRRCIQTADSIYPHMGIHVIEDLAECDFGEFENKNYNELSDNPAYQEWIDSNGMLPFPGGESREAFADRSLRGLERCIEKCRKYNFANAAVIVHGGTIMSIMEAYAYPHKEYYHWQVKNGDGFHIRLNLKNWGENTQEFHMVEKMAQDSVIMRKDLN